MPCYCLLFPHHCYILLIIAVLKKCADHWGVRRYCQPREADIPDRVHYACDVNEIGTLSAVCHQRSPKQKRWMQGLITPHHSVYKGQKERNKHKNHLFFTTDLNWHKLDILSSYNGFWVELFVTIFLKRRFVIFTSQTRNWNIV